MKNERVFVFFGLLKRRKVFVCSRIDVGKIVAAPHSPPSKEGERKGVSGKSFLDEENYCFE